MLLLRVAFQAGHEAGHQTSGFLPRLTMEELVGALRGAIPKDLTDHGQGERRVTGIFEKVKPYARRRA